MKLPPGVGFRLIGPPSPDFFIPPVSFAYPALGDKRNPERELEKQIECYRRMIGEQRLAIALGLHELSCNVAREGIRQQNPEVDAAEVERLLRQRLELARQ